MTKINEIEMVYIIARTAYEANRAFNDITEYCLFESWDNITLEKQNAVMVGVKNCLEKNLLTAESIHNNYLNKRIKEGWQLGSEYDEDKKTSKILMEFNKLPIEQQILDKLFPAIIRALEPILKLGVNSDNNE